MNREYNPEYVQVTQERPKETLAGAEKRLLQELREQEVTPGQTRFVYGICPRTGFVRVAPLPSSMPPEEIIKSLKKIITFYCGRQGYRGQYSDHPDPYRSLFNHYDGWSVNPPPGFDHEEWEKLSRSRTYYTPSR